MAKVLLVLLALPVTELWVLISIGSDIGAFSTIALCFLTAAVGIFLLRLQSFALVRQVQEKAARGEAPAREMLEGMAMAIGGVFLLFPGFITDAVGFLLVLPFTRVLFISLFAKHFSTQASFHAEYRDSTIIDAEYQDVTKKDTGYIESKDRD